MAFSIVTARLIVRIGWRNVLRNWRHSLAALGTMAVGFLSVAMFQGYLDELLRSQVEMIHSRNMIGEIMVRKPGNGSREARGEPWRYRLGEREQRFLEGWIAAHPREVKTRSRVLLVAGVAHAGGSAAEYWGWGHDVAEGEILRRELGWNALAGHPLRTDQPETALLSLGIGATLGCEVASDAPVIDRKTARPIAVERPFRCKQPGITLTTATRGARINAADAEVVGLTTSGGREFDERMLWMPLPFAQRLADTHDLSTYMIALHRPAEAPRLRAELRDAARAAGLELEVLDWQDSEGADMLRRGLDLIGVFRGMVVVIMLIIAGAAVLTTMMKTVRERTREVGALRSLGYRRHHLMAMFAVEAALLAVLAGAAGLVASLAATAAINSVDILYKGGMLAESIPLRVGYSPAAYAWGFVFLSLVAVAAALLAARGVTRMRIATALTESQ